MAILPIVKIGDPILRRQCPSVGITRLKDRQLRKFLGDMVVTMRASGGVGIAANQAGRSLKIIALECRSNKRYPKAKPFALEIFINPRILKYSKKPVAGWEGCLSIPGYRGLVPRSDKVTFEGVTPEGKRVVRTVSGFHARVIQHEVDHVTGIFYTDRMPDLKRWMHVDEFNKKFGLRIKA